MSGYRPKKSFGQHFLADRAVAAAIAARATTPTGGTVLEIGAGLGALTTHLLTRAAKVIAIERDRDLVPRLRKTFAGAIESGALTLLEADAMSVEWESELRAGPRPHVVAGNIPYAITGLLLSRATVAAPHLDGVVFMIQREVANRLAAGAGEQAYGALSVFVQAAFDVELLLEVPATAFNPPPAVDSAVVRLTPGKPPRAEETEAFRVVVKRAFAARRKTLRNAYRGMFEWSREELEERAQQAGIDLGLRGETLSVEEFAGLARLAPLRGEVADS